MAGSVWCREVNPAVAVDRHRQVFLPKDNDATTKPADVPLALLAGLEVEADKDSEPQDKCPDLFAAFLIGYQCADLVDRRHDGFDL